ncbi:MAG TPA: hypothetical protein VJK48_06960 [Chlamydiales bacterium]|nr:hypothetical protein [Chlamydiales bacterium]
MFLEEIGKLFFSRLPTFFFYLLLSFPILSIMFYLFTLYSDLQQLEESFLFASSKATGAIEKKLRASRLIHLYTDTDPYFFDHHIENLSLLEKEKSQIQSLLLHPAFSDKETLRNRLLFLEKNQFAFSEENFLSSGKINETEEKQRFPVEVDSDDLAKFCALIEQIQVGPYLPLPKNPQLIFLDFRIRKVDNPFHLNHYELETKILKREWISGIYREWFKNQGNDKEAP